MVRFLIDECLSPDLLPIAWAAGFDCAHVTRIGRQSASDWQHVQYAVTEDWVLVTNNSADFVALVGRVEIHPGLICLNVAHGRMNLEVQKRLFKYALRQLRSSDPINRVVEVTLDENDLVHFDIYTWPS